MLRASPLPLLSFLFSALTALSLVAGCGGGDDAGGATSGGPDGGDASTSDCKGSACDASSPDARAPDASPDAPAPSGDGGSCSGVVCSTPPAAVCADAQTLATYDSSGTCSGGACLYTKTLVPCAQGCANGACIGDPCAGVTCNKPPAATCVDATTLKKYAATGTCAQGACSYAPTNVTCPFGCANGACVGDPCSSVTCNMPPASYCLDPATLRSFADPGSCAGGSCTYAPQDTTCQFGCSQGACSGDPCAGKTCNQPPAAYCVSGSTLRSFSSAGTCAGGSCTYAHSDTTCAFGCANGACAADPCSGVTCDTPPQNVCDGSNARIYASNGTCSGGTCSYASTEVGCTNGCSAGACNGPTCGNTTCNAPPPATCTSATRLHTYAPLGTCGAGNVCSYSGTDTDCSEGCFNGACIAGSWTTEILPQQPIDPLWYARIALDPAGRVHIAACNGRQGSSLDVVHYYQSDYGWREETVDPGLGWGCRVAMAIGASGQPVFAYYDGVNQDLRYAERTASGSFTKELVATAGNVGQAPSITVDASGAAHVAFLDATNAKLRAGTRAAPNSWKLEDVVATSPFTEPVSELRYDAAGALHAVVGDATYDQNLKTPPVVHAVKGAGGWTTTTIATSGLVSHRSLSFTAQAEPQILYAFVGRSGEELRWQRLLASGTHDEIVDWGSTYFDDYPYSANKTLALDDLPGVPGALLPIWNGANVEVHRRNDGGFWPEQANAFPKYTYVHDRWAGVDGRNRFIGNTSTVGWAIVTPPACTPSCSGRTCGGDGCGGSCGTCASGYCSPQGTCGAWQTETIELPVSENVTPSPGAIGVPTSGTLHAMIFATSPADTVDALDLVRAGGTWAPQATAVANVSAGRDSFALLPNGAPAVAYLSVGSPGTLGVAQLGAGGWTTTAVASTAPTVAPVLAIDGQGHLALAYEAASGSSTSSTVVQFATNASGSFVTSLAASQNGTSIYDLTSTVDGSGHAHVVFMRYAGSNGTELRYATNASGSWVEEDVAPATVTSDLPSIVVDASLGVHILYTDGSYKTAYATRTGPSTWTTESPPGYGLRLRLDPTGVPVVLARTTTAPQTVQLLRRTGANAWSAETIPTYGNGYPSDFRFDALARPYVLEWETLPSGGPYWLRYATKP